MLLNSIHVIYLNTYMKEKLTLHLYFYDRFSVKGINILADQTLFLSAAFFSTQTCLEGQESPRNYFISMTSQVTHW